MYGCVLSAEFYTLNWTETELPTFTEIYLAYAKILQKVPRGYVFDSPDT